MKKLTLLLCIVIIVVIISLWPQNKKPLDDEDNSTIIINPQFQLVIDEMSTPFPISTQGSLPINVTPESSIQFEFNLPPDKIVETIYSNDMIVASDTIVDTPLPLPTNEGIYRIELSCTWKDFESTYSFLVFLDLPITYKINQTSAYPGDSFAILISNVNEEESFTVTAPFYNETLHFYPYEDGFLGIIPVYAWSTPGKYQIKASNSGTETPTELAVEILTKTFDVQYLKVNESTAAINTTDNSANDQVYFDAARANPIQEKLWTGPFIQPVEGKLTTDYCATRYTNDNPTPSRHLAIDIANTTGTPIMASNNGKVVLAKELIITGNTIVIDHGLGIFTSSFHLNEINVKEGDFIEKGTVIGKMGSTGFSTGSHLHFAIWKDGTFLNPWTFFEKDPVEFK